MSEREEIAELRERIDRISAIQFEKVDTNKDGFMDKAEVRAAIGECFDPLPPDLIKGLDKDARTALFFEKADTNADDKVSFKELHTYMVKMCDDMEAECDAKEAKEAKEEPKAEEKPAEEVEAKSEAKSAAKSEAEPAAAEVEEEEKAAPAKVDDEELADRANRKAVDEFYPDGY